METEIKGAIYKKRLFQKELHLMQRYIYNVTKVF